MLKKIKNELTTNIPDSEIEIADTSNAHANHYETLNQSIPSHLTIKVISDKFQGMNLVKRHRLINNIMQPYFNQGLHALQIVAQTKDEVN